MSPKQVQHMHVLHILTLLLDCHFEILVIYMTWSIQNSHTKGENFEFEIVCNLTCLVVAYSSSSSLLGSSLTQPADVSDVLVVTLLM